MNNKKLVLAAVALVAVIALFAGIWFITRPEGTAGEKSFTLTVIHKDGTEKVFHLTSSEEFLGAALVAEGIIVESNKFCEYWSFERMIDTIVLPRDFGYPVCSIEKEYINTASGQLRTRFQAFVESVELKKIQEGK